MKQLSNQRTPQNLELQVTFADVQSNKQIGTKRILEESPKFLEKCENCEGYPMLVCKTFFKFESNRVVPSRNIVCFTTEIHY
jgi:hypothetical protein